MMKKLQIKKHALTAISYMLPLVVASGLLIAIGNLTSGQVIENYQAPYSIPDALVSLGVLGMGLLAPVIAAAIAYSIADRPGIAPGFTDGGNREFYRSRLLRRHARWLLSWLFCSYSREIFKST